MVLNRKTDRRRRLLVDSNSLIGEASEVEVKSNKRSKKKTPAQTDVRKAYAVGAKRRHQRKVTDLIPKRRLSYSFAIIFFATLLTSVNLLAYFAPSWQVVIGRQGLEALAISGPSSLTTYLTTIFFAIAAVLCFQIYALRQHRCDDYEGTYRVWGWLAPAFAIASLACVLPLTAISQNIFTAVSGREFAGTWVPIVVGIGFASLFFIRYLMEVRYSYGTIAWSALAWVAISTSWASPEIAAAFSSPIDRGSINDLALGNGLFVAAAASLLANLTYARFVFLRSNGFIKAKPKQIKSKAAFPFRPFRDRTEERRTRADRKATAAAEKEAVTADKLIAKQTKKTNRKAAAELRTANKAKKTKAKKAITPAKPVQKPEPVATSKPVSATPPVEAPAVVKQPEPPVQIEQPVKQVTQSASERLKQLAAATRIQKTPEQIQDQEQPSTIKLSKAERRRRRKQQKNQNRAA